MGQLSSEEAIAMALGDARRAPSALDAICALRSTSEQVFEAVQSAIGNSPCMSWSLIESLNRLPWYNGMRAFLSLPDPPMTSPTVYPFYMLARNKVFYPTDMSGLVYDYHFNGLWAMLPAARSEDWRHAHPSALAIVELLYGHLRCPDPDPFVVYFSALMLGEIGPLSSSIQALQTRVQEPFALRVRETAALTLTRLGEGHDGVSGLRVGPVVGLGPAVHHAAVDASMLPALICNDAS